MGYHKLPSAMRLPSIKPETNENRICSEDDDGSSLFFRKIAIGYWDWFKSQVVKPAIHCAMNSVCVWIWDLNFIFRIVSAWMKKCCGKKSKLVGRVRVQLLIWVFQNYLTRNGLFHRSVRCTVGWKTMKSTRRVLGHSLLRSLVRSHRSLIRLLCTARFARSLAHSGAHGKEVYV